MLLILLLLQIIPELIDHKSDQAGIELPVN